MLRPVAVLVYPPRVRYEELSDLPCSITRPLVVLGDRWTLLVLKFAFAGVRRFNGFRDALEISRSRLQDRLDRLVEHGILVRVPIEGARHHEYRLTQKGHDLYPVLMAIKDWGDAHMAPDGPPVRYRHRDCAGPDGPGEARVRLACDACGASLTAREVSSVPGPGLGSPSRAAAD
jgi:DNA-binding HxlR family transcriptional regulator